MFNLFTIEIQNVFISRKWQQRKKKKTRLPLLSIESNRPIFIIGSTDEKELKYAKSYQHLNRK